MRDMKRNYFILDLSVEQAFPCKCRLGDKETAPGIESKVIYLSL